MKTLVNSIFRFTLSSLLLTGYSHAKANSRPTATANLARTNTFFLERTKAIRTALGIYQEMNLGASGLNEEAFEYAYVGYERLRKRHLLHKTTVLSVCDFSQASSEERMYVIDILNKKLLYRTYVAHGINSGKEYANSFSNRQNSYKSSLGFYITRQSYYGDNGLSLRIRGMDRGFNDLAGRRNIVIHGAPYVSTRILKKYGVMGTTFGCPAIPDDMSAKIIPVIKKGTCFFIYYPSRRYLAASSVLNG
ncbi:MAG TPA: murein L,D-transpeptidase catalytic domain family protein [Chryseolinea sp.]|nr:murein L,D-transpeptidase catalytic domain family protein [Chryseolinea sp.]